MSVQKKPLRKTRGMLAELLNRMEDTSRRIHCLEVTVIQALLNLSIELRWARRHVLSALSLQELYVARNLAVTVLGHTDRNIKELTDVVKETRSGKRKGDVK